MQLDGSGSSDSDGTIVTYQWSWPGGSAEGVNPSIELTREGPVDILLTVTDNGGATATDRVRVLVQPTANIPPVAVARAQPASGLAPLTVDLDGRASTDEDGTIVSYSWDTGSDTVTGPVVSRTFPTGTYEVVLTVTDNQGATGTDTVTVQSLAASDDSDGDGIDDDVDTCPTVANPDQTLPVFYSDADADGLGNPADSIAACEAPSGYVANKDDNCPTVTSSDTTDTDNDGIGDACDEDDDNDGIPDGNDCAPLDSTVVTGQNLLCRYGR